MPPFPLPLDKNCQVIDFHPYGIFAIEKACGIQTHPNAGDSSRKRNLIKAEFNPRTESYKWKDKEGKTRELFLVHRLDSPTSGVMLASSNQKVADLLKNSFEHREVKKIYFALVSYRASKIQSHWRDFLRPQYLNGKKRMISHPDGKIAITQACLDHKMQTKWGPIALLKLAPVTGRTHQLRVQSAMRKMPILGDRTYGNFELNRKLSKSFNTERLYLHAQNIQLSLRIPNGQTVNWEVTSTLPAEFTRLLEGKSGTTNQSLRKTR
jgi:tRNA pseudouridine65 synthase